MDRLRFFKPHELKFPAAKFVIDALLQAAIRIIRIKNTVADFPADKTKAPDIICRTPFIANRTSSTIWHNKNRG